MNRLIPRSTATWFGLRPIEVSSLLGASALVLLLSYQHRWPITVTEAWGFVTGGICVWLVVREHVWNWPIGLANNVFFFVLFLQSRLFADMGLQVIYLGLGIYGWLNCMPGSNRRSGSNRYHGNSFAVRIKSG